MPSSPKPPRRGYTCKPRRARVLLPHPVLLTDVDAEMLDDLLLLGAADTKALLVLRRGLKTSATAAMSHDARRLTTLMHGGWVSRFDPKFGSVAGSQSFLYTVETGRAMAAAATRRSHVEIPEDVWAALVAATAPLRDRMMRHFVERGFERSFIDQRLENHTRTFLKFYSGESAHARHKALCAAVCAVLWLGWRARGEPIRCIRADGIANLSFVHENRTFTIEPDCAFQVGTTAFAIEAETGATSRKRMIEKVQNYATLLRVQQLPGIRALLEMPESADFRVLFYCKTAEHARMVSEVLAQVERDAQRSLLIATVDDVGLERTDAGERLTGEHFLQNLPLQSGHGTYDYLRDRICAPVFGRLEDGELVAEPLLT